MITATSISLRSRALAAVAGLAILATGGAASAQNNVVNRNEDAIFSATKQAQSAILNRMTPVSEATLKAPADGDWLTWRRTPLSDGYSPLKAINKASVKGLAYNWSYTLAPSNNEITPIVHDGVMFIASGNAVVALDAAQGDLLWQYVRPLPPAMNQGRTSIIKGMAIYGERVFAPTADGHMIALEAKTGKLVWDTTILNEDHLKARISTNGAPIVAKGKVMMGVSGCQQWAGGCWIFGLDADTGKEAWKFYSLARPGEPGGDSWNGSPLENRFGGSVWTSGSYDPDLGLVYFGIGQTYKTASLLLPMSPQSPANDGLYTASTVALDPDTGKPKWHFQHVKREVWDLDWVYEQALITMPDRQGKPTKLVVTGGKIALFDAVDRTNGKFAFHVDAGIQTLITAVDPVTGDKTINPILKPEPNVAQPLCPHSGGGRNWPSTSIDLERQILFVQLLETCQDFTWKPRTGADAAGGGNDMQWVLKPMPNSDGKFGRVQAIDLKTGKTLWMQRQRSAFASSTLATAGGLVFVGGRDRFLNAFDSANGKTLWRTRLPASPSAAPITYTAGGVQYLAIVAGNGGPVAWPFMTPEVENPTGGTTVMVYRLP